MKHYILPSALIAVAGLGACLYAYGLIGTRRQHQDGVIVTPAATQSPLASAVAANVMTEQRPMLAGHAPPDRGHIDTMPDATDWKRSFPSWDPDKPMRENGAIEVRVIAKP